MSLTKIVLYDDKNNIKKYVDDRLYKPQMRVIATIIAEIIGIIILMSFI